MSSFEKFRDTSRSYLVTETEPSIRFHDFPWLSMRFYLLLQQIWPLHLALEEWGVDGLDPLVAPLGEETRTHQKTIQQTSIQPVMVGQMGILPMRIWWSRYYPRGYWSRSDWWGINAWLEYRPFETWLVLQGLIISCVYRLPSVSSACF